MYIDVEDKKKKVQNETTTAKIIKNIRGNVSCTLICIWVN